MVYYWQFSINALLSQFSLNMDVVYSPTSGYGIRGSKECGCVQAAMERDSAMLDWVGTSSDEDDTATTVCGP